MTLKLHNHITQEVGELLSLYAYAHGFDKKHPFQVKLAKTLSAKTLDRSKCLNYIDELAELTNNPTTGLDMGQLTEPKHIGILGYLLNSSENLAVAGMQFLRYQKLLYSSEAEIFIENQSCKIVWPLSSLEHRHFDECQVSAFAKIANSLTEQKLLPLEVGFRQAKPDYTERYQAIFGINVQFGCKQTYISYPLEYLTLEIKSKGKKMQEILEQQAQKLLSHFTEQDEFEQKLNVAMIEAIQQGQANLETVSHSMHTSARTLQRQLSQRDTTFNKLLTSYRQELSQHYLKDKNLSLTEVSFLLGYAEQSVFTRTFKSWYGITPKEFRKEL